jgi:hypothetical protein
MRNDWVEYVFDDPLTHHEKKTVTALTYLTSSKIMCYKGGKMKLYIAVLDDFPDYMVPTLVAHAVLGAHMLFSEKRTVKSYNYPRYMDWLKNSFKKCVVRVNQKEFAKIAALDDVYIGHEKNTLDGRDSCIVVCPMPNEELPNVLKFAKLWKPKYDIS